MRIALIADIHSNILALEAVMKAVKKHSPDMIISLGDQVNLGPCPRETLALLANEGVSCLHGNHERYILSAMAGDPGYAGANFASPRYNASLLTPQQITFPQEMQLDGVTFCHAMPGDDRFPVFDPALALPRLREMAFDRPTHIICGHGHNPSHIRSGHVTIDSIGAVGCMDDGVPGTAPYAILTLEHGQAMLRPYYAAYETRHMKDVFRQSGMADYCPIMAHLICLQMSLNQDFLVGFVQDALALSRARRESVISEQTWQDTDASFSWPGGVGTADFWK
ncbi:MAG: metallophosphoesterase [Clostridia bacterium]|nr:metallophosphoesterase [Clostridia bacterium]